MGKATPPEAGTPLNPGGSVKDRSALSMINSGEEEGRLSLDKIILDVTSGNIGIAYAMVAALTVTTASLPAGTVGVAYSAVVAATGGVSPLGAWTVSQGAVPAGLTLAR